MESVRVVTRVGIFEGRSDGSVVHFDGPVFVSDDVDVVECFVGDGEVTVLDRFIDFIVPARASPYRVLDMEELADALSEGHISIGAAAKALRAAQAFVDTYLHRVGERQGPTWKDFPPASIAPYLEENRRVPTAAVTSPLPAPPDWRSVDDS